MILRGFEGDAFADGDFVYPLLLDWRTRCAVLRAPWELTAGRAALRLCVAVVRTLEQGRPTTELGPALRAWGATIPSASDARAALQCLGESVSQLAARGFGEFRVRGLDPVLEALAQEALIPTGRRTVPVEIDGVTRCPVRGSLERDLATAVTAARVAGETLSLAVLQLDTGGTARRWPAREAMAAEDSQLLALLSTIRRGFGSRDVYRVGREAFAVLAPGVGTAGLGELILQASCIVGPRFDWGTADLRALEVSAVASPDVLLLLAEADLAIRKQDREHATGLADRRRQLSVVGAAAALLLVAGAGFALGGHGNGPGAPQPQTGLALPARVAPHGTGTSAPPTTAVPVSTAPPPSAPPLPTAPVHPSPPASNTVLATFVAAAPLPPPPSPAPVPSAPTTTAPAPGNSASAPGHVKHGKVA